MGQPDPLGHELAENQGQIGDGENDDPESLANSLKDVKDVLEANATDHEVSIITPEAEDILASVVSKANERGVKLHSIDIREPNLEAVFLHLTGRALRY